MPTKNNDTAALQKSIDKLERAITELHATFVFHSGRTLWMAFLRGIVYGLGMIAAVAIVLPFLLIIANQIQWVPLVGDFVLEVAERMGQAAQ